jgi:hypothetical protein
MSLVIFPHLTLAQCTRLQTLQAQLADTHVRILAAIRNQDGQAVARGFAARCVIVDEQLRLVCGLSLGLRRSLDESSG